MEQRVALTIFPTQVIIIRMQTAFTSYKAHLVTMHRMDQLLKEMQVATSTCTQTVLIIIMDQEWEDGECGMMVQVIFILLTLQYQNLRHTL